MPIPIILGIGAAIAGAAGLGAGIHGGVKMKEAKDTIEYAKSRHEQNLAKFEEQNKKTLTDMDNLGKKELEIVSSFKDFSFWFEQIKNKPIFKEFQKNGVTIPQYDPQQLRDVSVGAGALLAGLGGAAMGTAGGFAAAGVTTAAVMALGTASTGTAIASLSGAAATNAALAAIGGGSLAAGGGGMALGSAILGGATLGVGLLVGGIIFNITGSKLSEKADEAYWEMRRAEDKINSICDYCIELSDAANKYFETLEKVDSIFKKHMQKLIQCIESHRNKFLRIFNKHCKVDWNKFSGEEKLLTENTALLVNLLYSMCKVQLVLKSESEDEINKVNTEEIEKQISDTETALEDRGLAVA